MLQRELEPEVMDDPEESQAYDEMDHDAVNQQFAEDFLGLEPTGNDILDLGTGTARIPIVLCKLNDDIRIMASDAAVSMLEIARINVSLEGLEDRVQLNHSDAKQLVFEDEMFDSVISNSLLHHLPEPAVAVSEMVRVCRPGGRFFVRDLMRPESHEAVEKLVAYYAGQEDEMCRQLFRQSLIAALTVDELAEIVEKLGFERNSVQATSDRHLTWSAVK